MEPPAAKELIRRLSAAFRAIELYSPTHPVVRRGLDALGAITLDALGRAPNVVVGFIADEVVVDDRRLTGDGGACSAFARASLVGFARAVKDRGIEKITLSRGATREDVASFMLALGERNSPVPLSDRLSARGIRNISVGRIATEDEGDNETGIAAARKVYSAAVETAEALWETAKAGDKPDPGAARKIIDSLAKMVSQDRTSLLALTALKKYDNYTFTHMVNVSALSMAQARALNITGPLLREFGFAALMHDIGKVNTPTEVLNKPDKLTREEFEIMKRHVVDGAHILRRTPEMPALAPIVAFEHHLKQDMSGYPENIGTRSLNLCTQIVSIADVFDALRSNRVYRQGLPTSRIRAIMGEQGGPALNARLLKRFINLIGLFPVGTLVRLDSDELGVVTAEHPSDPFRPQVKVITDCRAERLEEPVVVNTWDRDGGEHPRAVVEAVDPEPLGIDPLQFL